MEVVEFLGVGDYCVGGGYVLCWWVGCVGIVVILGCVVVCSIFSCFIFRVVLGFGFGVKMLVFYIEDLLEKEKLKMEVE